MYIVTFSSPTSEKVQNACNVLANRVYDLGIMNTWIPARGSGPMAVGNTWEHANSIASNSRQGPDEWINGVGFEHKAGLVDTGCLQTLYCKEPGRGEHRRLLEAHNTWSEDEQRYGLYVTISAAREAVVDGKVFMLALNENKDLSIMIDNSLFAMWSKEILEKTTKNKLDHVLVVPKAIERDNAGVREFMFIDLKFFTKFSYNKFVVAIEEGEAVVDVRAHLKDEYTKKGLQRIRNHGTAFRVTDKALPNLFEACGTISHIA